MTIIAVLCGRVWGWHGVIKCKGVWQNSLGGFPVCIWYLVPGPSLWELPRQAMITEAEVLRELTDTLVDVLQHESNVTATKAWSRGLIGVVSRGQTLLSRRERVW